MSTSRQAPDDHWYKKNRTWLAVFAFAAAVVVFQITKPKPKSQNLAPITQSVTALGRFTPQGDLVRLSVPAGTSGGNEVVDTWFVQEGSQIRKGQLLARLSSYKQLRAAATQASATLDSTKSLLPYLIISKSKGAQLYSDGAVSEEELGKATASVVSRKADIVAGTAAAIKAQLQLEAAEIKSPLDGTLIQIYSWPGMKETNEGLAIIGRTNQMQVWAQVYQSDLKRLQIGQSATVRAESGGFSGTVNARLASIVESISNRDIFSINGNNDVNARVVLVKLNVDNADQKRISSLSNLNVIVRFDK